MSEFFTIVGIIRYANPCQCIRVTRHARLHFILCEITTREEFNFSNLLSDQTSNTYLNLFNYIFLCLEYILTLDKFRNIMASNMSLLNLGYELTDSEDEDVSNQGYDPNALPLPLPTDLPSDFVAEESPIIAEDDSTLDELPTSVLTVDPILIPTEDSVSDSRPDSPEQEAIELQETIDATDEIDATDAEDSQIQLEGL